MLKFVKISGVCAYGHQMLQTACSYRGSADGVVNSEKIYIYIYFFIIKLMQYKDTSQEAFLIIYLICILACIYFSLGRFR